MTKKILFCTILLLSAFSLAQTKYFELTPKWLVSVQDSTKNYIVVDVQNSNTEQLYKKAIKYVNEKYKNPEAVLRGRVENEFLTFVTHDDHMFDFRNGVNLVVEVNYLTTISFKENKIKINFHDIEMTWFNSQNRSPFKLLGNGFLTWYVYKEKDYSLFQPKKEFKNKIELFFNDKTNEITSYFLTQKSEEW